MILIKFCSPIRRRSIVFANSIDEEFQREVRRSTANISIQFEKLEAKIEVNIRLTFDETHRKRSDLHRCRFHSSFVRLRLAPKRKQIDEKSFRFSFRFTSGLNAFSNQIQNKSKTSN